MMSWKNWREAFHQGDFVRTTTLNRKHQSIVPLSLIITKTLFVTAEQRRIRTGRNCRVLIIIKVTATIDNIAVHRNSIIVAMIPLVLRRAVLTLDMMIRHRTIDAWSQTVMSSHDLGINS